MGFSRMLVFFEGGGGILNSEGMDCPRILNSGGAAALVDYVSEAHGNAKLPGIMAVGYIAAFVRPPTDSRTSSRTSQLACAIYPILLSLVEHKKSPFH